MPILHSKTALNRTPRNLCSQNANSMLKRNSVVTKCKFPAKKSKFCAQKMQDSKLQWCAKHNAQNSALRKWKFCTQEMEIQCSRMEIMHFFVPNRAIPHCHAQVKISALKSTIAESWRDWPKLEPPLVDSTTASERNLSLTTARLAPGREYQFACLGHHQFAVPHHSGCHWSVRDHTVTELGWLTISRLG